MICKTCQGKGARRYAYPSNKPIPAYWFEAGAKTCEDCDGTGETPRKDGE